MIASPENKPRFVPSLIKGAAVGELGIWALYAMSGNVEKIGQQWPIVSLIGLVSGLAAGTGVYAYDRYKWSRR